MDSDIGRKNLERLKDYYEEHKGDRNEATTRLHLINKLLFECLGWNESDCETEEREEGEYTDYTLSLVSRLMVVEAKREGKYFELPIGKRKDAYSINSLCQDSRFLKGAISQAAHYCQKRGIPIGVVSNGHQFVGFLASRRDGKSPSQGEAVVFDSLDAMLDKFKRFWNCFSKEGVREEYLVDFLRGHTRTSLPPSLSSRLRKYPSSKDRNPFQSHLSVLADLVLEDLPHEPEVEEQFLRDCYCESGALSQYAMISKRILRSRYEAIVDGSHENNFTADAPRPTIEPISSETSNSGVIAGGLSRRPILLIGDVGVGKSTFIRNLVKVQAKELFGDALALHINLGVEATLTSSLRDFILTAVETQLLERYGIDIYEERFVKGIYNKRLDRFRDGIYGKYYETDIEKYREKEIELLESLMDNKNDHLKASVRHIVKGRNKQVVIFIDNADQRADDVQEEAFLVSQELASGWLASVFVSLRPETYHESIETGALSGYHPRAFTLAPPRVDKVLEKRLNFSLKIATGKMPFLEKGDIESYAEFSSLEAILRSFKRSLRVNDKLVEAIDNISGGNIRQALELTRDFFGSGHVDTKKIVDIETQRGYTVPLHEFLRSIIYRDAKYYHPPRSPVLNLYDVTRADPKEHFLSSLALSLIVARSHKEGTAGFYASNELFRDLQNLGFRPSQIYTQLERLYSKKLITTSGRRPPGRGDLPDAVRISTTGAYHLDRLSSMFTYIDAVIVTTPILRADYRKEIKDTEEKHIITRLDRADIFRGYLDEQWSDAGIETVFYDWRAKSRELKEAIDAIRQRVS